ncbi:MAG TPA: rRNA maturation RNase YbeY [Patescibacteria group bacterium]|nr:rRNA maturation RNase YbeY [Patescibacteria group bacterium]
MINVEYNIFSPCPYKALWVEKVAGVVNKREKMVRGVVEINVVDKKTIKKINREWRGKNQVTDVLSFAWQEGLTTPGSSHLGEIYLCFEKIKEQAKEFKVTAKEEFARMLVHGLLHLVGYDHLKPLDAKKMFKKQEMIIKECLS